MDSPLYCCFINLKINFHIKYMDLFPHGLKPLYHLPGPQASPKHAAILMEYQYFFELIYCIKPFSHIINNRLCGYYNLSNKFWYTDV